jgi:hypothetical protein
MEDFHPRPTGKSTRLYLKKKLKAKTWKHGLSGKVFA